MDLVICTDCPPGSHIGVGPLYLFEPTTPTEAGISGFFHSSWAFSLCPFSPTQGGDRTHLVPARPHRLMSFSRAASKDESVAASSSKIQLSRLFSRTSDGASSTLSKSRSADAPRRARSFSKKRGRSKTPVTPPSATEGGELALTVEPDSR